MKSKEEVERALDGALREVYDLAKQLGLGSIGIQAHPDIKFGYATSFEPGNVDSIYTYSRVDFNGEV